jgi:hypothetical protein
MSYSMSLEAIGAKLDNSIVIQSNSVPIFEYLPTASSLYEVSTIYVTYILYLYITYIIYYTY